MNDEIQNIIKEQYAKLPRELQLAIQSAELHNKIIDIGTKNHLHLDQMGLLEEEITLLMMGFTDAIEFVGELQNNVHTDATTSQKIATEVNQEILLPIRAKMEIGAVAAEESKDTFSATTLDTSKSVVMPSAQHNDTPAVAATAAPTPTSNPVELLQNAPAAPEISSPVATPAPVPTPPVDVMFNEPTISLAPQPPKVESPAAATPPTPPPTYKADPYHEPID